MKILHLISGGDKGGAKTHMFALLDELCKIADVTVICLMKGVFYDEILQRPVRTLLFEQKIRMDISVCSRIASLIKDEGFEVVNAHGARANFIAILLKNKINIPIVTTVHSDYKLDFDVFYKKLIFENLNKIALRKIKYKIAVSDSFKDMLIERGFAPNDILTVYNGMNFDDEIKPISRIKFAEKFGIPYSKNDIYVGIAARLNRVKGVDIFIRAAAEAASQRNNVKFIIAGNGEEREKLLKLVDTLGIADKVYFLGFVSPVYDFLNFIDINMLTSLSESFPYLLLEGAKAKKATISSDVGGIPHLISDGETGLLFKAQNYKECAEKIIYLVDNPEKITEFGQKIYEKASSEFSNKNLANAYLNNYKIIISKFKKTKKYDIVLSGYYGFDNFGDELVLATLVSSFIKAKPDINILILTKQPEATKRLLRVNSQSRYDIWGIISALNNSRMYICGGGTLLTDVTSTRSLLYYITIIKMARRQNIKVMLLSNGIGPFLKERNKKRVLSALKYIDLITLRDSASMKFLNEYNADKNAVATADVSFLYTPQILGNQKLYKQNLLKQYGISGKYFVVSLREWKRNAPDFESIIARCCDYVSEKYKLIPVFIPLQPEKDLLISKITASKMKQHSIIISKDVKSFSVITNLISGSEFSLGMRLHNIIYAVTCGIPVIGLSYDDKVKNFICENNIGKYFDTENIVEDELILELDNILQGKKQDYDSSKIRINQLHEAANSNITAALSLLDS